MTELPELTQGTAEPSASRVVLTMSLVSVFGFVVLYGVLYAGHPFPGLGSIIPLFSELGSSVVWFFIAGIILGISSIVAMALGETIAD